MYYLEAYYYSKAIEGVGWTKVSPSGHFEHTYCLYLRYCVLYPDTRYRIAKRAL